MTNKTTSKPKRKAAPETPLPASKKTNLQLSSNTLEALRRLKEQHGMSRTFAIERGVILLEQQQNARFN